MVSPRLSWSQPRSIIREATATTWSMGTSPSQGSPKHIETYARTHRPSARARATTGANIAMDSSTLRLRFLRAKVSVAPTADLTEQSQQGSRVGQLGDPLRRYERRRLDSVEPCIHKPSDELGLDLHRDDGPLVLQTVAGSDLVDGDPPGHTRLSFTLRSSHLLPPCSGPYRVSKRHRITRTRQQSGHTVDTLSAMAQERAGRYGRDSMSEPTGDGKQQPDPEQRPEAAPGDAQNETSGSVFNDPTAPVWADPTAPIPAMPAGEVPSAWVQDTPGVPMVPPAPPGVSSPYGQQPAAPRATPPASNPYAQQPPAPPYAQPVSDPYGQQYPAPPYGQQYPAPPYGQPYYATGAPSAPSNTSAIILTIVSGLATVTTCVIGI